MAHLYRSNQSIGPDHEMLRALAYIWSVFGAYWIIFAAVVSPASSKLTWLQRLQLLLLVTTFALLLWKARVIPAVLLIMLGLAWAGIGLYWVAPRKITQSGENRFCRVLRLFD